MCNPPQPTDSVECPTDEQIPVFTPEMVDCETDEQIPVFDPELLECPTDDQIPVYQGGLQYFLDKSIGGLQKIGAEPARQPAEIVKLLDEIRFTDQSRIALVGKTLQHLNTFHQVVRDGVESIGISARYLEIIQMFDSIREDSKTLIKQLDDGKLSFAEKATNLWMRIWRGTPSARFAKIAELYKKTSWETANQLAREVAAIDAYIDFRFALHEAELVVIELKDEVETAATSQKSSTAHASKLEFDPVTREEQSPAEHNTHASSSDADRTARQLFLLSEVAENLRAGAQLGEALITKLKQTHDVKQKVFQRSVEFFSANEPVFKVLGTACQSPSKTGTHSSVMESAAAEMNDQTEDLSGIGRELERAALKSGYGSTISPMSVEKLVTAISDYQIESSRLIAELREESETNATAIRRLVEESKSRLQATVTKYRG